uniref:Uncharacterized protein n=1 Tax=Vitis vinifera TaxID=29760 RepID=F6I268_VITVI
MEKTTSLSVGMMQKKSKGLMRGIFMNWIMDFDDRCHKLIDGGGSELETESVGEAEDEEGHGYGYKAVEWTEDDKKNLADLRTSEIERNKATTSKQEINKRFKEFKDRADIKEKIEALKVKINNSEMPTIGNLDDALKEKTVKVKKEIEFEMAEVLKSMGLDVQVWNQKQNGPPSGDSRPRLPIEGRGVE